MRLGMVRDLAGRAGEWVPLAGYVDVASRPSNLQMPRPLVHSTGDIHTIPVVLQTPLLSQYIIHTPSWQA